MTTPVPTHESLEALVLIAQQQRDNADVFYAMLLDRWDNEAGLTATFRADLFTLLNDMNGRVDGINAALEVLNNNSSLNAQNQQNILLGSVGACCDDVTPVTGLPDNMCINAQQLIATMPTITDRIEAATVPPLLPTVDAIVNAFTVSYGDGIFHPLISSTDANKVLAAITALGVTSLGDIHSASTDSTLQSDIKDILGTATNSTSAYNQVRALENNEYSQGRQVIHAFLTFYAQSVISALWADPPIFTGEGYEDDCGGPPFEGSGFSEQTTLTTDTGIENWSGNRATWDLDDTSDGSINPTPYTEVGRTFYIYNCGNASFDEDRSSSIWLGTDSFTPDSIFLEIPLHAEVEWVTTGTRFLYLWTKGQPDGDDAGIARVIGSWNVGDASTHCPA